MLHVLVISDRLSPLAAIPSSSRKIQIIAGASVHQPLLVYLYLANSPTSITPTPRVRLSYI